MRGEIEFSKFKYNNVIFSIFIEDYFDRDKFLIKSGLPRPALVKINNTVAWTNPPSENTLGTRFKPQSKKSLLIYLYENSLTFSWVIERLHINIFFWKRV